MSIIPQSSSAGYTQPFFIENFRTNVRTGFSTSSPTLSTVSDQNLDRISYLVARMRDELAKSALSEHNLQAYQSSVDESLKEISDLLGRKLTIGGVKNAIVRDVNSSQITDVEVLALPVNGQATFSGRVQSNQADASVIIGDIDRLRNGGTLSVNLGGKERSISIRSGASLSNISSRINSRGLGVRASIFDGRLRLTSTTAAPFQASIQPIQIQHVIGANGVDNVNELQVSEIDISGLSPGAQQTISGTRDSLATAATLTYSGNLDGSVKGSVDFDLSGDLGTVSLFAVKGETLDSFTDRINDASIATGISAEVVGNNIQFSSTTTGRDSELRIDNVSPVYETTVEGVDPLQVTGFYINELDDGSVITLEGSITQSATSAELTYQATPGGLVADSALFTISGDLGSQQINIAKDEAISEVRDRVNSFQGSTGVSAEIVGNQLVFKSLQTGSASSVQVTLDDITQYIDIDGVNATQVSNFNVVSAEPSSTNTLSANVTQAAMKAELTYNGFLGTASSSARFTLSGALGNAEIEVTGLQSLSSLRNEINDVSMLTGVTAEVSGNQLKLTSSQYGSLGTINIAMISGTFDTTGGDGNGNAAGQDALLTINGDNVTASGNSVSYADSLGSYTFDLTPGLTGAIDPIIITSEDGTFDLLGGDESDAAFGVDAEAILNGQTYVGTGNDFDVSLDTADFTFSSVQGFAGTLDPITLRSTADTFEISGGDGNGFAIGQDGAATINGTTYYSADHTFGISTEDGDVELTFQPSFIGNIDDITIDSSTSIRRRVGVKSTYRAHPNRQSVQTNSQSFQREDGRHEFENNGVRVAVTFAPRFQGNFDEFTVAAGNETAERDEPIGESPFDEQGIAAIDSALGSLFELASGGQHSIEKGSVADAYSIALDALSALQRIGGNAGPRGRSLFGVVLDEYV